MSWYSYLVFVSVKLIDSLINPSMCNILQTLRVRYIYETVVEYQEYSDQNVMSEPSEFSEKAAFSFEMFSRFCPSGVEKLFSGG